MSTDSETAAGPLHRSSEGSLPGEDAAGRVLSPCLSVLFPGYWDRIGLALAGGAVNLLASLRFFALKTSQSSPDFPNAVAEIPIQRKKKPLSPWLLIALAALALTLGAYWYLRPAPADEPAPRATKAPASPNATAPTDSLGPDSTTTGPAAAPDSSTTRNHLLLLVTQISALADRSDLRDDPTVREQRDNLTSATARLADGDAHASLRPGLVAAANLLRAIQQRAYPALNEDAMRLVQQAGQLSGRDDTAAERQQNQSFLQAAGGLLQAENTPSVS